MRSRTATRTTAQPTPAPVERAEPTPPTEYGPGASWATDPADPFHVPTELRKQYAQLGDEWADAQRLRSSGTVLMSSTTVPDDAPGQAKALATLERALAGDGSSRGSRAGPHKKRGGSPAFPASRPRWPACIGVRYRAGLWRILRG